MSDSLAAMCGVDGDFVDVHLIEDPHRKQIADDDAVLLCHDVETAQPHHFRGEELTPPWRRKRRAFDAMNGIDVRGCGLDDLERVLRHSVSAAASLPLRPAARRSA